MACKGAVATIFFDKDGKQTSKFEVTCRTEGKDDNCGGKEECKPVESDPIRRPAEKGGGWIIQYYCRCVEVKDGKYDPKGHGGFPEDKKTPCQIGFEVTQPKVPGQPLTITPVCFGTCDNPRINDCRPRTEDKEFYSEIGTDGKIEVGWRQQHYCQCKPK
jgi:hypothetical protein